MNLGSNSLKSHVMKRGMTNYCVKFNPFDCNLISNLYVFQKDFDACAIADLTVQNKI